MPDLVDSLIAKKRLKQWMLEKSAPREPASKSSGQPLSPSERLQYDAGKLQKLPQVTLPRIFPLR